MLSPVFLLARPVRVPDRHKGVGQVHARSLGGCMVLIAVAAMLLLGKAVLGYRDQADEPLRLCDRIAKCFYAWIGGECLIHDDAY